MPSSLQVRPPGSRCCPPEGTKRWSGSKGRRLNRTKRIRRGRPPAEWAKESCARQATRLPPGRRIPATKAISFAGAEPADHQVWRQDRKGQIRKRQLAADGKANPVGRASVLSQ